MIGLGVDAPPRDGILGGLFGAAVISEFVRSVEGKADYQLIDHEPRVLMQCVGASRSVCQERG